VTRSGPITRRPHTTQATEVDYDDRTNDISDNYDIEGWTGFNFPGRKNRVDLEHFETEFGLNISTVQQVPLVF
jgi:hypothetical protein